MQGESGITNNVPGPKGDIGNPGLPVYYIKEWYLLKNCIYCGFCFDKAHPFLSLLRSQGEPGPDGMLGTPGDIGIPVGHLRLYNKHNAMSFKWLTFVDLFM